MEKVPITFEYEGKIYTGSFDPVFGAGGDVWYLMVNKYYLGRLRVNDRGWFFDGNQLNDMADYFGEYMMAWYQ